MSKNKSNKQLTNKLAGKETSLSRRRGQKSESNSSEVSKKNYIRSHVEHFVLCLRDAYSFKDPMEVISGVTERLHKLFSIPIEKVFKWFYGNALGWSTNNLDDVLGLPEVDHLGFNSKLAYDACKIFGGRLQVFLQKFFRRQVRYTKPTSEWKRRKEAFARAQTFLMFKKGSPQVSSDLIADAARKHREAMSNSQKAHDFRRQLKEELLPLIKVDGNSDFVNPTLFNEDTGFLWGVEATEAEIELERKAELQTEIESQAETLIEILFKPGSFKREMKKEKTLFPSSSAHSDKGASSFKGGATGIVASYFEPFHSGELLSMSYHPRTGVKSHYQVSYPFAAERIASDLLENEFEAVPVYLQEPLKVRTITKGPALPYWFLLPVQKFLWSSLLRHPVFCLIGEPISKENLNGMLQFVKTKDEKWLSGDYSAATDNLAKWLIEKCWSKICSRTGIPDPLYELGLKGLTGHKLKYDEGVVEQQNGQLMGSPLSFPLLCLCNAAICSLAFDKNRRNFHKLPMRINGDDCVMSYTEEEKRRWSEYANFIGMSPSPGKCYFAEDWLQMNSELFVLRGGSFRHINFTNFSLASPYLAKGGEERTIESLSQTMQSFCFGKSEKAVNIWIRRMAPFIKKKVPGVISWYLPQCLGGLGLMSNEMGGSLFSHSQLQVATKFYQDLIAGGSLPYHVSSVRGGLANFRQVKKLNKYISYLPILDKEVVPVKEFWSERFFKERGEEEAMAPLLWENLIQTEKVVLTKRVSKPVLNNQVLKVFKNSKKLNPLPLTELLRLRGVEPIVPSGLYKSSFEPSGIFLDILAKLTQKQKEVLTM